MRNDNTKFEQKKDLHQKWLGQLQDFFAEHSYIPKYEYMAKVMGFGSVSTVAKLVQLLKDEGFLEHGPDTQLVPKERFFEIPVSYDTAQAGPFTEAYGQGGEYKSIQDLILKKLIRKPSITGAMQIRGDSMEGKRIYDGDWGLYEKRPFAEPGDIVFALLDGENKYTLKELGKENGKFILIPHNPNFEIIRNKQFLIHGVLTKVVRDFDKNALATGFSFS